MKNILVPIQKEKEKKRRRREKKKKKNLVGILSFLELELLKKNRNRGLTKQAKNIQFLVVTREDRRRRKKEEKKTHRFLNIQSQSDTSRYCQKKCLKYTKTHQHLDYSNLVLPHII